MGLVATGTESRLKIVAKLVQHWANIGTDSQNFFLLIMDRILAQYWNNINTDSQLF